MEINKITFAYDDQITRLHEVSTKIKTGEITTIIGPNGSGKSTFMNILTRSNHPQTGNVLLNGKVLNKYKPKELAQTLGVVYQNNVAPADMTIKDLVAYGRLPYKNSFAPLSKQDEEKIEWALTCTGLFDRRHETIDTLSGGQQQRAWIAMALAQDTPYLLLDEPTSNLDIYYQYEILELVKSLCRNHGLTIVMVLHDINQAIQYSDTVIIMKDGKIVAKGHPKEIVTEQTIYDVYGIRVVMMDDHHVGKYVVPIGI